MTSVLAQLSDPHLRGDESEVALQQALAKASELRPDAVLLTGDLSDAGRPQDYERTRALLEPLGVPFAALPGNHDDPAALRAVFPDDELRAGVLRVVLCDTTVPGHDHGAIDAEALDARLTAQSDAPTVVALHHPPIALGMPALDAIALLDAEPLAAVLRRHPQVRRLICGH